jgi:hypothetical protein
VNSPIDCSHIARGELRDNCRTNDSPASR